MPIKKKPRSPTKYLQHPRDYVGYSFLTAIRYVGKDYICIVSDSNPKKIDAYVLNPDSDYHPAKEKACIELAIKWANGRRTVPFAVFVGQHGYQQALASMFISFNHSFVDRVMGPLPEYPRDTKKIRRRMIKRLPSNINLDVDRSNVVDILDTIL